MANNWSYRTGNNCFDAAIVGAGPAGGALAVTLARRGASVAVLERQERMRDRGLGEVIAPWGTGEARAFGVLPILEKADSQRILRGIPFDELSDPLVALRDSDDLSRYVPGESGPLVLSHPGACVALVDAAQQAGARVELGVQRVRVVRDDPPTLIFIERSGAERTICARWIIAADGRNSTIRTQLGGPIAMESVECWMSSMLVAIDGNPWFPRDWKVVGTENSATYMLFPRRFGRNLRLYLIHKQPRRFAGAAGREAFMRAFSGLASFPFARRLEATAPVAGPVTWKCDELEATPIAGDGRIILIGDAAGFTSPLGGQGLSMAFRDGRLVYEAIMRQLSSGSTAGFAAYADDRALRMQRARHVTKLLHLLRADFSAAGRARRQRIATSKLRHRALAWLLQAGEGGLVPS